MKVFKKLMVGIACSILMLAVTAEHSFAGEWCACATVTKTGAYPFTNATESANYKVDITCHSGEFAATYFYINPDPDSEDSNFATSLTAMATGNKVQVQVSGTSNNSLVSVINLLNYQTCP